MTGYDDSNILTVLDIIGDIYFEVDLTGRITFVNDSVHIITGFSRQEMIGLDYRDCTVEECIPMVRQVFNDVYKTGRPAKFVNWIIKRKDGGTRCLEASVALVKEGQQNASGFRGIARDITQRTQMENELNIQKAYFQQLFENSPEAILILDHQDRIIQANKGFVNLFNYSMEEIIGRLVNDLIIPQGMAEEASIFSQKVLGGEAIQKESQRKRRDGTPVDVSILAYPIKIDGRQEGIYAIYSDITRQKKFERKLKESQRSLATLLGNLPGMAYRSANDRQWTMQYVSQGCLELTGYQPWELQNNTVVSFGSLIHPEDRDTIWQKVQSALKNTRSYQMEYRLLDREGQEKWVWEQGLGVFSELNELTALEGFITDITQRKLTEDALKTSQAKYKDLADSLPETVFEMDLTGKLTFVNSNAYNCFGYTQEDFEKGLTAWQMLSEQDLHRGKLNIEKVLSGEKQREQEYTFIRKDGSTFPVIIHSGPIIRGGKAVGVRGIIIDITERKQAEERLKYLSHHDPLTGLYNRTYFEMELLRIQGGRQLPTGIIVCDVDGLKLVNDTLGHDSGDALLVASAGVIRYAFRQGDMIARIGGDEFAILLPNSDRTAVENAILRLREAIKKYNLDNPKLPLSISAGCAVSGLDTFNPREVFKEADNNMYREKLHRRLSARSSIVQAMMKALEARDFITEGHADRMQGLAANLAKMLNLPRRNIADLRLLAQFHDIGKVGIPDNILFKPGPLTPEEFEVMKRHCEIGHRIAYSAPELAPIADWILKHHEWWDGSGYPLGLKGKEIPLECRILSIADAFDAMTSHRPYRKALSHREALEEINRCAGTQFDPTLAHKFKQMLEESLDKGAILPGNFE